MSCWTPEVLKVIRDIIFDVGILSVIALYIYYRLRER